MNTAFYIKFSKLIVLCFLVSLTISCNSEQTNNSNHIDNLTREDALAIAIQKYNNYASNNSPLGGYPRAIKNSRWTLTNWKSWTDGFFPGILWQLSIVEPNMVEQAERWTLPLKQHATLSSHDVGFIINNSFGKAFRLTGNSKYLTTLKNATITLSNRFNSNVGAIRSWDFEPYNFPVIIDNLMNLALLYDSAKIFNSEPYYSQAVEHTYTTLKNHIRDNGSSFHLIDFNSVTGEVVKKSTVQGFTDKSTWARGQAWGIYGFTLSYIESGNSDFLFTAEKLANYFIDNLPEDTIPFWDFDINDTAAPKDSSAAAVAAAALWMLSNQTNDQVLSDKYQNASISIIDNLISTKYFSQDETYPALLLHATGNKPGNKEVDTSLIYADYFFIEALLMQLEYIYVPV